MTAATAAPDPELITGSGPGADADDGTETISWADFRAWERQLASSGACTHPIRLRGRIDAIDRATGETAPVYDTASEHGGVLHVACGNRREAVCPACSAIYGPVSSDVPKVGEYLLYWLKEIVQPNLAPKTYQTYELFVRLHIDPYLGHKRLDRLQVKDIRQWLNKLASLCQCCTQGKDVARPESRRRCCAIGKCCMEVLAPWSRKDARDTLRAALTCAVEEEIISRNPVSVIRLPAPRKHKCSVWTVDEARRFLESARRDEDALYTAYVLILVLGLRKGEVLGAYLGSGRS